ncbi:hypothetical protein Q1695_016400 [Nippostrongylus brasiliensis]|nr:hypothetical protein Q1695_016400 [Nippostrongylus brasiliensis]
MRYAVTQRFEALWDHGSTMKRFLMLLIVAVIASGSRAHSSEGARCVLRPGSTTSTVDPTSPEPPSLPKPVVSTKLTCNNWKKDVYDQFFAKYNTTTDCTMNDKAEKGLKHFLNTGIMYQGFVNEAFCQLKYIQPYAFYGEANVLTKDRVTSYLQKLESKISAIKHHRPSAPFGCAVQVQTAVNPIIYSIRFNKHYLLCIYYQNHLTGSCDIPD